MMISKTEFVICYNLC